MWCEFYESTRGTSFQEANQQTSKSKILKYNRKHSMVKWSLLIPNKRKEGHTLEWSKLRFVVRVCSHDFTQCHCTQLLLELLLENVPKKYFPVAAVVSRGNPMVCSRCLMAGICGKSNIETKENTHNFSKFSSWINTWNLNSYWFNLKPLVIII